MYKIIGADQQPYGPVTSEQVRKWIKEGRLDGQSLAQREGTSEWERLDQMPEFALALASLPPVPPVASAVAPAKTSGLAIASLVLGLLGLFSCGLTALAGLALGWVALGKIRKNQGHLSGRGLAISGISVSAAMLLLALICLGLAWPALTRARQQLQTYACINNVRQLCLAARMYADATGGKCPPADSWCDILKTNAWNHPALRFNFKCPFGDPAKRCDYAYNAKLDGLEIAKLASPARTVMIFEAAGGWNVSGGPELTFTRARHGRSFVVGFADGHVELVARPRISQLRWDP